LTSLLSAALSMDSSNNATSSGTNLPILSFEIPIQYNEYYDASNNLLRRDF
jgi:hypothetical protein